MIYCFDTCPDRRETENDKSREYSANVLRLWVTDMDFIRLDYPG